MRKNGAGLRSSLPLCAPLNGADEIDYLLNLNNLGYERQSGASFAYPGENVHKGEKNMDTAYLLAQLTLALGALGIIYRAVWERAQDMGMVTGGKEL